MVDLLSLEEDAKKRRQKRVNKMNSKAVEEAMAVQIQKRIAVEVAESPLYRPCHACLTTRYALI